jgi:subtilisin family serine protease
MVKRAAVEKLEGRIFLSAGDLNIINVEWNGGEVPAVAGQYVAQIGSFSAWSNLVTKEGFTDIRNLGGQGFYQFSSTLSAQQILGVSKAHPFALKVVQPNFVEKAANTFPDDPLAVDQWGLLNTGQNDPYYYNLAGFYNQTTTQTPATNQLGTPGEDIDAQQAWDITTGSSDVVVAVLDSGTDITQPDLVGNLWTNPNPNGQTNFPDDVNGWNFVADNNDVSDDYGHGTAVAGIIGAAGNNSLGVTGVDWHVSILTVKVLDSDGIGADSDIIAGINYVTMLKSQGVNIVVMNESMTSPEFPSDTATTPDFPADIVTSNAVKDAGQAGILDVVAAGNDSVSNDVNPTKPADAAIAQSMVISVAAIDNQGKLAAFSNFGASSVQLAAPGVDILTTAPTYPVPLSDSVSDFPLPQFPENSDSDYGYLSGTSMAAPFVTGIIALEASVEPAATPQQLRTALLDGVTYDPNLASVNGLPPKVATSGVANAYLAIKDIQDQFVSANITHEGNWIGFYGGNGEYVVGDSTTFPSFVNGSFDGVSPEILDASTRSPLGLQNISGPPSDIEAFDAASSTEAINLTFTDGQQHRVGLYVADLDRKHRTEEIQIIDVPTGLVLNTQYVGNFLKGEYLFWDLQGSVQIKLTNLVGPSAVFSGIFFDPVPADPNVFTGTNTAPGGMNWQSTYGSQGDDIVGDPGSQLPAYVTSLTLPGTTTRILKVSKAPQSLEFTQPTARGIQAYWQSTVPFNIDVDVSDTELHQITLYLADYDNKKRAERIQVINPNTGLVSYTQDFANFSKGIFATFTVAGNVVFHVIPQLGPSAVVSGIFFDAAPGEQARFIGTDGGTFGAWKAAGYGSTFAAVAGDNFPGIDDLLSAQVVPTGATERILNPDTSDPRALEIASDNNTDDRVEGYLYAPNSMTFYVNPGDNLQHEVAMYFADYENLHRVESITITDPATGTILARQRISNFPSGKYLLYNISGAFDVTITADSVGSAVLSGIFVS